MVSWQQRSLPKLLAHAMWGAAVVLWSPRDFFWLWLPLGILAFSLAYYLVHRFVLHASRPPQWTLRFDNHRWHHAHPNDVSEVAFTLSDQLLLSTLASVAFALVTLSVQRGSWLGLGFASGFVAFDQLHTAIHHETWGRRRWVQRLGANHLRHHNNATRGYYDTLSPLWDIIFGTRGASPKSR